MTTIILELTDDVARLLEERARQNNVSPAQLAASSLQQLLQRDVVPLSDTSPSNAVNIGLKVIEEDHELLLRLAQ